MKYSIIIPIYKEKKNLKKLIKYLNSSLKFIKHGNEIIFVDDDSMDGSISEFKKNKKKICVFMLEKKNHEIYQNLLCTDLEKPGMKI